MLLSDNLLTFRMSSCDIVGKEVDSLVIDKEKHNVCDVLKFQKLRSVDVHHVASKSVASFQGKL